MDDVNWKRRQVVSILASLGGLTAASRIIGLDPFSSSNPFVYASESGNATELVRYPQKTDLLLLTDRPPQLETPLQYFQTDLTPNNAFFVRWHLAGVPTDVVPGRSGSK
jgi:hypothetical protein